MPLPTATLAILPSSSPAPPPASSSSSSPMPPLLHSPIFLSLHAFSRRKPSLSIATAPDQIRRTSRSICCGVALKSDADVGPSSPDGLEGLSAEEEEELKRNAAKEGARVRVKVPLKVYHVPRIPEMDLTGMEGVVKQYVCFWKGKRISANLPFKVEFQVDVEGRGRVKFFAHLREDEIDFI